MHDLVRTLHPNPYSSYRKTHNLYMSDLLHTRLKHYASSTHNTAQSTRQKGTTNHIQRIAALTATPQHWAWRLDPYTAKYAYDSSGHLTAVERTAHRGDYMYMHEALVNNAAAQHLNLRERYTYSSSGQRILAEHSLYGYRRFSYDTTGKLLRAGSCSYSYDKLGRLRSYTVAGRETINLNYERIQLGALHIDRLRQVTNAQGTFSYHYAGSNPMPTEIRKNNQTIATYRWKGHVFAPQLEHAVIGAHSWIFIYEQGERVPFLGMYKNLTEVYSDAVHDKTKLPTAPSADKWLGRVMMCRFGVDHLEHFKFEM